MQAHRLQLVLPGVGDRGVARIREHDGRSIGADQREEAHARLHALHLAIDIVRRGGTISLAGVYGGMADPMPMLTLFDKQIQLRMGQANVLRWAPEILPLLADGDPLGVEGFASHQLPLRQAPQAYEMFQHKQDGAIKILLRP